MKTSINSKHQEKPFTVLDTFAGAGGFSLGFDLAGYEVIGAIESDKWASETFAHNHPKATTIRHDITKFTDEQALEYFGSNRPDVIVGGPPCQGFSIASKTAGDPKDPRNSLFREFVRLGRVLHPKMMVMENVPNLIQAKTSDGHLVIDIIKESLEEIGFNVYWKVLSATHYGVPQIRSRLFVVASRDPLESPFPAPTHVVVGSRESSLFDVPLLPCPTLWDAISDLPELAAREGGEVMEYTSKAQNAYQEMIRKGAAQLFNHKAMNHTPRIVERFKSMQCGDTVNDVPEHLKPRKRNSQTIALAAYDQNNRRMHADRPCHTVPASFYANFVHPFQHRNFTAREGARIQSFPDWYRFLGKPTVISHKLLGREGRDEEKHLCQYSQIGNAVPPLLAKAVALNLKPHM